MCAFASQRMSGKTVEFFWKVIGQARTSRRGQVVSAKLDLKHHRKYGPWLQVTTPGTPKSRLISTNPSATAGRCNRFSYAEISNVLNIYWQTYPRPLNLPHTPSRPAAACKGAKLLAWSFACGRESAGPPAISARLGIPAGRDRTTLVWCRGSTPAPIRDAREDGGFTARKTVRRLSGC
jgi:hypothetical protein